MPDKQSKPPRRGGSVTLPKGATKQDVDDALRKPPPDKAAAKEKP